MRSFEIKADDDQAEVFFSSTVNLMSLPKTTNGIDPLLYIIVPVGIPPHSRALKHATHFRPLGL
ncbi:MAG: hypothetical protein QNK82_11285 [Akkermansiaceae bacterium]|nr:hypothetical protein [uncultured bacterium]